MWTLHEIIVRKHRWVKNYFCCFDEVTGPRLPPHCRPKSRDCSPLACGSFSADSGVWLRWVRSLRLHTSRSLESSKRFEELRNVTFPRPKGGPSSLIALQSVFRFSSFRCTLVKSWACALRFQVRNPDPERRVSEAGRGACEGLLFVKRRRGEDPRALAWEGETDELFSEGPLVGSPSPLVLPRVVPLQEHRCLVEAWDLGPLEWLASSSSSVLVGPA